MRTKGIVFEQERPFVAPSGCIDVSRYANVCTDTAVTYTKLPSGLYVASLNGTTSKIALAVSTSKVSSFLAWVNPTTKNRSIVDFDSGTHSVELDNSASPLLTATGWASPTIYVNAQSASAIVTLSTWQMIVVTTATTFTMSALVLGQEASFYVGQLTLGRVYNYALSASQVFALFQKERALFGV